MPVLILFVFCTDLRHTTAYHSNKVRRHASLRMKEFQIFGILFCMLCTAWCYQVKPSNYDEIVKNSEIFFNKFEDKFFLEQLKYDKTGNKSQAYADMIDMLKVTPDMRRFEIDDLELPRQVVECTLCRSLVKTYLTYRRVLKYSRDKIAKSALKTCNDFGIQEEHVCSGLIEMNIDIILHIIDNRPNLTATTICGVVFQSGTCRLSDASFVDWEVKIDPNGSPITKSKESSSLNRGKDFKIVQLTDFHYDPKYVEGKNAVCKEPLCCRDSEPTNVEDGAGRWGDYRNCDAPWDAVVDAIEHVQQEHPDADYIYYTGDIIDHGVWETTVPHNIESMKKVYELFRKSFGFKPLFPILGNHEVHPVNVFPPDNIEAEDFKSNWLYDLSAEEWSTWLPAHTKHTIQKFGYYTVLVHSGFRIIALNNNECYTYNWWILYDPTYLSHQLQWLHDTLLAAEKALEKVHILAHVPSGEGSCYRIWAREYRRIVDRFWNTISAQFNGHTHRDEMSLYYSMKSPEHAINVAFNGGSTVTYSNVNPNYIVYYVNNNDYQVNNFESWIYNLTAANEKPDKNPEWFKLYSFKDDFDIPDLSPTSVDKLVKKFATNKVELKKYWEYKVKLGDPYLLEDCDDDCLLNHLCEIVTTQTGDDKKCEELTIIFNTK